uniref:Lipocalin/cytosolic fatty-acid binding domain-containing protein n=2 Tax=Homalodisca liturata TaxID=320908 RepID=A0A1B6J7Z4_9HEMI
MDGTMVLEDPSKNEGKFEVILPTHFMWWNTVIKGSFWVLDTDYESYSVGYSCAQFFWFFHDYTAILFSRVQDLSQDEEQQTKFFKQTYQVLIDHNLDPANFKISVNKNCTV